MKGIFFLILLHFYSINIYPQKRDNFSVETNTNCSHYFMGGKTKNDFNYGFSLLLSRSINKIKISTGITYSTKYYYYNVHPQNSNDYLNKRNYRLQYINFPLTVNFINVDKKKLFYVNFLSGLVFNKLIKYNIISFFNNKSPLYEKDLEIESKLGLTLRLGTNISKTVSNSIILNVIPFFDLKLISNNDDQYLDYKSTPDDWGSIGISIGIEFIL